ncbi:MAG: hypothetical protein AAF810_15240 [Cyanobacteria bacterium P01_D01_bin.36]
MMNPLSNLINSVSVYAEMSPDLTIRCQVNQWLQTRTRRALSLTAWCRLFSDESNDRELLAFVYQRFSEYSGLEFGRVRPGDRLNADLHLALVSWYDWVITFVEDFCVHFHIDLSDRFDEDNFETIGELVTFLHEQVTHSRNKTETPRLQVVASSISAA